MKWYKLAAEQGLDGAQYTLGEMYRVGEGVLQDAQEAAKWFRKAAEQGFDEAQFFLGLSYTLGKGVPQDYVLAHKWLNLAAAQGYEKADEFREEVATEMNTSQIQEAQRLARNFKPKKENP